MSQIMFVAYFGKKDVERSPPLYGCWQLTQQLCILCILIIDNNQFKEKRTLIVLPDSQLVTYPAFFPYAGKKQFENSVQTNEISFGSKDRPTSKVFQAKQK